ncbi:MAG: DUF2845 domain-containing protein [Desulfobacterales bacterium]|jgi:hypothetical protein
MKKTYLLLIGILFGLSIVGPASAAMRCDNFFVKVGVHSEEVLVNCGEPMTKSEGELRGRRGGRSVEKRIYGPESGYIYILYFSNGVLEEMDEKKAQ